MKKNRKCMKCGYWNAWDAAFCGLCYEPFDKKPPSERRAPAAPPTPGAPQAPAAAPRPLLVKGAFLLLGLAAASLLLPSLPQLGPEAPLKTAGVNRFAEKSAAADRLLAELAAAKDKLLAEISAGAPDPEGFGLEGQYTTRLMKLEDAYAGAVNALALPCPTCVDKERDAAYLAWTEEHLRRENEAAESFSRRYQQLVQKALAGK